MFGRFASFFSRVFCSKVKEDKKECRQNFYHNNQTVENSVGPLTFHSLKSYYQTVKKKSVPECCACCSYFYEYIFPTRFVHVPVCVCLCIGERGHVFVLS